MIDSSPGSMPGFKSLGGLGSSNVLAGSTE
jgi:hypothetical protein